MTDTPNIKRLLKIASMETGGGRRVAEFLLSLWDGEHYRCDLQSLLYLDLDVFRDMQHLLSWLHHENKQLDQLASQGDMDAVLAVWGHAPVPLDDRPPLRIDWKPTVL